MAAVTLQVIRQEATGVVYADPAKPDTTCRFRNTNAQKTLNGVPVPNYRTEIIYNDNNSIEVATGVNAVDAVSIRLSVSGTLLSATRINNILNSLAAQLSAWETQNVFKGFLPTSAPVITTP